MHESEEKYRAFFENTGTAVLIGDEDTTILMANAEFERLSGYSREEMEGKKSWTEFLSQEDLERMQSYHKSRLIDPDSAPKGYEFRFIDRQGMVKDLLVNVSMIPGTKKNIASFIDLTKRKKSEDKIRHLNRFLLAIRNVNQLITQEKDRERLLKSACKNITENGEYHYAWIALTDESGSVVRTYQSGFGNKFKPIDRLLKKGEFPWCVKKALSNSDVVVEQTTRAVCAGCPLESLYQDTEVMSTRLEYDGKLHGVFVVAGSTDFLVYPEEKHLFKEIAGDISFALNKMELEEQRRRAEEALKQSEELFRLAFENANVGVCLVGLDGRFTRFNHQMCEMFGYSREELEGKHVNDLTHPEDLDISPGFIRKSVAGEVDYSQFEKRYYHKKGHLIYGQVSSSLVRNTEGAPLYFISHVLDITERKLSEAALQRERDLLNRLMETSPAGILMIDSHGRITFANPRAEEVLGLSRDGITGWTCNDPQWRITGLDGGPFPEDELPFRQVMDTGRPVYDVRHAIEWPEGQRVVLSINAAPLFDTSGSISGTVATVEDITGRLEVEKQLRDSEEKFRELYDNAPVGYHELDTEGRIIRVNLTEAGMLRYRREEMLGRPVYDFIHPDERNNAKRSFKLKISGKKKPETFERKYVRKDGSILDCLIDLNLVRDERGRVTGMLTTLQDISGLKKAEKALECRLEMERIIAAVSASFVNVPYDGFDKVINDTLKEVGEFVGVDRSVLYLMSGDGSKMTNTHEWCRQGVAPLTGSLQEVPAGTWWMEKLSLLETIHVPCVADLPEEASRDKEFLQSQGIQSILAVPIASGEELLGFIGYDSVKQEKTWKEEDITLLEMIAATFASALQRKRAGEVRRQLQTAIEQAGEIVIITDTQAMIQYVNPTFERITGYSREEATGRKTSILNSGKHDRAFYRKLWEKINSGEVWTGRFINKKKDGTLYHEEATISPVRDAAGEIVQFVAVKRDISQQIELENQLRHMQKMESIGLLAGGVAHDFNNLLTAIMGYSSLIKKAADLPEKQRNRILEIEKASQRGAEITRHLLAFSRKKPPDLATIDLNDAVNQSVRFLKRGLGPDIPVETRLERSLEPVSADNTQIQQVLTNLCLNARDAMPHGGKIVIETSNFDVDKDYAARYMYARIGPHVLLAVTDNGTGMDSETLARIFEPFFTTKETGKGTGLGLSIVYGIIKNHGGFINVYSEPGRGTTFKIYLPRAAGQAEKAKPVEPPAKGGDETILIVDDERMILSLAASILEEYGYTCLTAESGKEALEIFRLKHGSIDLVILDLVMPRMSGQEVFEQMLKIDPRVSAVISSGFSVQDEKALLEKGVKAFIPKPYQERMLARVVREVLDQGKEIKR
ncbi:MAG: PAS domain S-box protein [Candidatus Glassbacteria bacterium]|nr:PAS domain S-box protein [Candidatus Glassbacteria bacterium]